MKSKLGVSTIEILMAIMITSIIMVGISFVVVHTGMMMIKSIQRYMNIAQICTAINLLEKDLANTITVGEAYSLLINDNQLVLWQLKNNVVVRKEGEKKAVSVISEVNNFTILHKKDNAFEYCVKFVNGMIIQSKVEKNKCVL